MTPVECRYHQNLIQMLEKEKKLACTAGSLRLHLIRRLGGAIIHQFVAIKLTRMQIRAVRNDPFCIDTKKAFMMQVGVLTKHWIFHYIQPSISNTFKAMTYMSSLSAPTFASLSKYVRWPKLLRHKTVLAVTL